MQSTHSSYDDVMESDEYDVAAVEDDNDNYYSPTTNRAADAEHYPSYFQPPTRASPVPPPDWWETSSSRNLHSNEASTPTSYPVALVFTILAMIGWHFQGPIVRWYQERIQWIFADATDNIGTVRLVWDALWSALVAALDYVRATYQMAYEMLRRMLQWILCTAGFGTEYYNYEYDYDDDNGMDDNPNGVPRNNGNQELRQTQRPFNHSQRSRCNSLPGLEECDGLDTTVLSNPLNPNGVVRPTATKDDQENIQNKQPRQHVQRNSSTENDSNRTATTAANAHASTSFYTSQLELEPAFLHDTDYPADWLVYHPVLRVVPKAQADLYDKQQLQRLNETKAEIIAASDPLQQPKPDEPLRDDDLDPASVSQPSTSATTTKAALYNDNNLHEEEKKDDVMTSSDTEVVAKGSNGWGTNGQHQNDNRQSSNNDTDAAITVPTTMPLEMQQPGLVNDGSQQQAPSDSLSHIPAAASSESATSFRAEVVT